MRLTFPGDAAQQAAWDLSGSLRTGGPADSSGRVLPIGFDASQAYVPEMARAMTGGRATAQWVLISLPGVRAGPDGRHLRHGLVRSCWSEGHRTPQYRAM